jgi:hypothetical protein
VGLRVGLEIVVKREIHVPAENRTPVTRPVDNHFTDRNVRLNAKELAMENVQTYVIHFRLLVDRK